MTEEDSLALNISDDADSENESREYSFREGVMFIIDTTEPMFDVDPEREISYFCQCLEVYKNILSEKLSWNKTDWMGIILMGTNKRDKNPEMKNLLTWQSFQEVSIDQLKKIEQTLDNIDKFREEVGSTTEYPLHDALWHATRCFNAVKVKLPFRNIVLLTRVDNPCEEDPAERGRIRLKVTDCENLRIRLSVVGMGKKWDPQKFFAEFEVCSGKFDSVENYQRTFLANLEAEVKQPSRITSRLLWTLGDNVKLSVSFNTITTCVGVFFTIVRNETVLWSFGINEDEDEERESKGAGIALPQNVYKCQAYGQRDIRFSLAEIPGLKNSQPQGIKLIGFKPISKLDISLHLKAPSLLTYDDSQLAGSKALFAALLKQCNAKEVMAICAVTLRRQSPTNIYTMIPTMKYAGFYAYRLPFRENIRDLTAVVSQYIYNETDNLCPINEDTMDLCHKFLKKSTIAYETTMFHNPKLRHTLACIESLAMDKNELDIPSDTTIPDKGIFHERIGNLKDQFEQAVRIHDVAKAIKRPATGSSSGSSGKSVKLEEIPDFKDIVRKKMVHKCTVEQLKQFLKSVSQPATGNKQELVKRVYGLFAEA